MESRVADLGRGLPDGQWSLAAMAGILLAMLTLMVGSAWNDSATYDELSHIGAGFAYILERDYRINPEAPLPLKAVSAWAAQLATHPDFPAGTDALRDNNSSEQGRIFLYESGNDADRIVFWARMPLMLLAFVFGAILFLWTRRRFGGDTALLTLVFFAFSPTFLCHSHLVNSDLGAAFGFFIGICGFLRFLEAPSWGNVLIAGVALGAAQLCKFSIALLTPLFLIFLIAWVLTLPAPRTGRLDALLKYTLKAFAVLMVALLLDWIVYGYFVWGSSAASRYRDAYAFPNLPFAHPLIGKLVVPLDLALIKSTIARPLGEMLLGLLLATARVSTGDFAYLFGKLTPKGSWLYFPALYLLKEPLPLHILTLLALWLGARGMIGALQRGSPPLGARLGAWIHANFVEFAALTFVLVYWGFAIRSGLNIGVRHVMPTFPFIYLLVARQIARWIRGGQAAAAAPARIAGSGLGLGAWARRAVVAIAILALAGGTVSSFPHFLPYYNMLAGGTANGWKVAIDSNYDWGQDLARLRDYVATNHINAISLDYFGRADPKYYLGKALVTEKENKHDPPSGWFAISASNRQMAFAEGKDGFDVGWNGVYDLLKGYQPVGRAGYSIFIYRLP